MKIHKQTYKPGPVISNEILYHLSRIFVTKYLKQSTPRHRSSKSKTVGILDLATHKVHSY